MVKLYVPIKLWILYSIFSHEDGNLAIIKLCTPFDGRFWLKHRF